MRDTAEQTILVTGASDGIGEEAARQLAAAGARVLVHGRSQEKVEAAGARIGGRWEPVVADLASLAQTRALVADVLERTDRLDGLLNNAGVGYGTAPASDARTEDGHEPTWQVNVLATHLLTSGLRERLTGGRVVIVSSGLHEGGEIDLERPEDPRGTNPYSQSKLAGVMLALEYGARWAADDITATSCSPGWVATKMGGRGASRTVAEGADTPVWLLTDPSLEGSSGGYYADRREQQPNRAALDPAARAALWELVERQLG